MKSFGLSDIGLSRQVNEDSFLITENPNGDLLVAVCDGIGGSAAGEVASNLAVTLLGDQFQEAEPFKKIMKWMNGYDWLSTGPMIRSLPKVCGQRKTVVWEQRRLEL